jgi:SWI/SNF-related matrix-associated actin-dependent regulator 1 of chromatin subfamily A
LKRTPSLIAAAREQHNSEEDLLVKRLAMQFGRVSRLDIANAVREHRGDPDAAINKVKYMHDNKPERSPSIAAYTPPPKLNRPAPVPATSSSYASFSSPPIKVAAKPRMNEKSAIYKHRGKGKRRDPDESESADNMSDAESDNSWSGDEGHRRKRKKGAEDEVDAEGEALKAFNEADAEVLTGTIGECVYSDWWLTMSACSLEQAATIIRLRPYDDADAVRSKLTKARGVSSKLFEQYTEIMEGYVQIDACLNRCEGIANDVANTLSVWRGAAAAQDTSVVGTPRSDGLNDVKVDVAKVSELLLRETDIKRKKILLSYIQSQPAGLSEGTVLKDYQLLGVNWLNLLYSKRIGCILADEMGECGSTLSTFPLTNSGLGKTIQVIAFLTHLKERGIKGPHMIFVP